MVRNLIISCEEVIMTRKVVAVCVILFGLTSFAAAKTIYVPGVGYATIQDAIDHPDTVDGDEIVVGPVNPVDPCVPVPYDVPNIEGNRDIDFRGKAITVRSRYGPAYCIIDCGGTESEPHRGFRFHSGETNNSVVQGFTIKNGYAYFGGAIECTFGSSPTIRDCIIYNNYADNYGGGIECYEASPLIKNCLIYNNEAGYYGGAIDCEDASPTIVNCTLSDNRAGDGGGGIFISWDSAPLVAYCIFESCSSYAIYEYHEDLNHNETVWYCLFYNNRIDPSDPESPYADYYDAETDSSYTGADEINSISGCSNNLDGDPQFRTGPLGDYYLGQFAAGQLEGKDSPCVDAGPVAADNIDLFGPENANYTTRTDNGANTGGTGTGEDEGLIDLGYHYTNGDPVGSYQLTPVVIGGNGSMEIDPCSPDRRYVQYAEVALTATPDAGYKVREWTGNTKYDGFFPANVDYPLGRTENIVTMTQTKTVTVEFELRIQHLLTTEVVGGNGILFPASGLQYEWDIVKLTATPDESYQVEAWTGTDDDDLIEDNGDPNVYNYVTMDSDKHVTVEFITGSKLLEAIVIGGNGTVRPRMRRADVHSEVVLTAYPDAGYIVKAWSQSPPPWPTDPYNDSAGDTYTTVLHDDTTVYIEFEQKPWYWLYTQVTPGSDGWAHGWLDPNAPQFFMDGTTVYLIAHPAPGYEVKSWHGTDNDSSTSLTNTITINGPYDPYLNEPTVTVSFRQHSDLPANICLYAPGPDGEPDWAAGPKGTYPTIQAAIDDAVTGIYGPYVIVGDPDATPLPIVDLPETPGDIVVVGYGTYSGDGNRDLNFGGKLITVRSEFGPEGCTINCGGSPSEPHRAFIFLDLENNGAVVDGFTIINGYADYGGAIAIGGISRPLIRNCIIRNNSAAFGGGGVYFEGLEEDDTTYEDFATEAEAAAAELEDALDFSDPCAPPDPQDVIAAMVARGMATFAQQIVDSIDDEEADRATLSNCKIINNKAGEFQPGDGGGIYCWLNSNPVITSTEISYNQAGKAPLGLTSFGYGGGVYCMASVADFANCLVVWNQSSGPGGGFYLEAGSDAIIILSTVAYNKSNTVDAESGETLDGIVGNESSPEISYCIIYHYPGVDLSEVDAEDSWVEDENALQSPMFVTGPYGDFYLSQIPFQLANSPAVDAGEADIFRGEEGLTETYGLTSTVTTKIISDYDYPPTDFGYHYPFYPGPPIKYTLIMHVIGNGTMDYSAFDIYVYPPVDTSGTVEAGVPVAYTASPGTVVTLIADPDPRYRVYEWFGTDIYPSFSTTNSFTMATENVGPDTVAHVYVSFEKIFTSSIHVPGDYAYNEIQNAIDAAREGDTIVLAPGTYPGTGYLVWGKNITITAEFPTERDNPAKATIIDCTDEREGGFHLIGSGRGECILNGLVILSRTTWWIADGFDGDDIEDNIAGTPGQPGGGSHPGGLPWIFWPGGPTALGEHYDIYFPACAISIYGNHTVANCTVRGFDWRGGDGGDGQAGDDEVTTGGYGGDGGSVVGVGMYVGQQYYSALRRSSRPLIKDCIIEDCMVVAGDGGNGAEGGEDGNNGGKGGLSGTAEGAGIYIEGGTRPTFKDCIIRNNQAYGAYGGDGGDSGLGGYGGYGGLCPYDQMQPPPSTRSARGAGVFCQAYSAATFIDCLFEDNFTEGSVSGIGGTWDPSGHVSQPNHNYKIPSYGSAVFCEGGSNTTFTNCIIRNNEAQYGYGAGLPTDREGGDPPELLESEASGYTGYGGGVCVEGAINSYGIILIGIFDGMGIWDYTFSSAVVPAWATFTDCQITDNSSPIGGGIYSKGSYIGISNCDFIENSSYLGGGLFSTHGVANISGCKIRDNMASIEAGLEGPEVAPAPGEEPEEVAEVGQLGIGGGIFYFTTDGVISDTVITNNFADVSGGGVYLSGEPDTLTRWGIAATPELKNCLITDNMAGESGGGVTCNISVQAQIRNCTIADNSAIDPNSYGGGIYYTYGSIVDVNDSILWANVAEYGAQLAVVWIDVNDTTIDTYLSKANVRYSDIANGSPLDFSSSSSAGSSTKAGGVPFLVEPETIYGQFDAGQSTVDVIVSLVEPEIRQTTNWNNYEQVNILRTAICNRQNTVLNSLTLAEFTERHIYENQAAFSGDVTLGGLNKLLADPLVYAIEPVRYVQPTLAQAMPLANALGIRRNHDGTGMSIAIVDSGVDYTHPMLGGGVFPNAKVIGGFDYGNNDADPMPADPVPSSEGHGTACAGIAAGDLGRVGDYIGGVASGAKIYALRISGDDGLWPTDSALAAWNWCITHQNDDPANPIIVMSNSWGAPSLPFNDPVQADNYSPAMRTAADNAVAAGITILAASGNDGFAGEGISWPAAMSNVISVGAVYDTTDKVTEYSNTADILDILAPADPVYTTDVVGIGGMYVGDYWPDFGGTSSSCPFAAGAVASLQSAALAKRGYYLEPAEVRNLLVATGDPVTDTKVDITKPRVNLGAAISALSYGPPVWVSDGCTLNGQVFYDFDPDIFAWYPGDHNLEDDPLFVDDYFLSQWRAGQLVDSNCVDAGSDLAENLGLRRYTTRTDGVGDDGIVDMGYHHPFTQPAAASDCPGADLFPIPSLGEGRKYGDGIINLDDIAILASCWLDDSAECRDADLISDGIINLEDFGFFYSCWLMVDEQGPEPAEWEEVPHAVSSTSVAMIAGAAFDSWGWNVEYQFESSIDPCSGWDELNTWGPVRTYQDNGLVSGQQYWYRFKVRDLSPYLNISYSEELSATPTHIADTTAPSPNPMTWAIMPYATSTSSIAMTATIATDPCGVEYQFDETSGNPGGTDSGWQPGTSYTDFGLSVSTQYCYRVRARDQSVNQNTTAYSTTPGCATTGGTGENLPPYPDADGAVPGVTPAAWDPDDVGGWSGEPRAVAGGHYMRADGAIDPEGLGVDYYFTCTTGEVSDSGWRTVARYGEAAREWLTDEPPAGTHYCYSCKYRDTSPEQVESAPSSTLCVP